MMKTRGPGAQTLLLETIANTILLSNSFKTFVCVSRVYFLRKEFETSPHTNSKPSFWIFLKKSSLLFLCQNSTSHVPPPPLLQEILICTKLNLHYMRTLSQKFQLFRPNFRLGRIFERFFIDFSLCKNSANNCGPTLSLEVLFNYNFFLN